jgi:D-arabinose 1-dehydrogenase-like Zn-dependent alcohol dehydrogenase
MGASRQRRSYKLTQFGAGLSEIIEGVPVPVGTQVLLSVRACGICHSDIHVSAGHFDLGHGQKMDLSRGVQLPRVLGHEIAGTIEEIGAEAAGVSPGERMVIFPWGGCGQCVLCRTGEEHLCTRPRNHGLNLDGGYSNYVLVDHPKYLVPFEPLPEAFAATLACSGLTAFSALKKVAPVDGDHPLLVIGAGGLGLAAIGLTRALYGAAPVVADIDETKRQAALDAGASAAIDPADPELRKRLLKETGGFAAAIDFVGAESTAEFGLALLRKGGRLAVVGLFGGAINISLPTLPLRGIGLIGSYVGSLAEFKELMALARAGAVKPIPIEARPLEAAQRSLDDLRAGRIRGRIVLTP